MHVSVNTEVLWCQEAAEMLNNYSSTSEFWQG